MKSNKLLLIALFTLMVLSLACRATPFFDRTIEGSGNLITESRDVSGFDRVNLSGYGQVIVEVGDEESLTVTTDDNIMPYVRSEVKNNTLVLDFEDKGFDRGYNPSDGITFNLVVKNLSRVDISGAGSMEVNGLETEKLRIDLSGAGALEISSLTADELVIHQSGAGTVVVSGTVKGQELSHSGVGSYHAADLESETAIVEISGAGSATVWATESLDVDISGLGHVVYYGNPRVIQSISGLGNLISAEK
ncbi:MAG: DUF2807 domain-containing protein [Anaerolineae bacterium]|nr:DUF2807 domain-containing protein [Anaerolineae bacterium]